MENIIIKSEREIEIMKEGGTIARRILMELFDAAEVGVSTLALEKLAQTLLERNNVKSAFKGYQGYKFNVVTCLNEEVVHGLPTDHKLTAGDLLTIDFGIVHKNFITDLAETRVISGDTGEKDVKLHNFLATGKTALEQAINQCIGGKRIGDIGHTIQSCVESAGYGVIRSYVGHGVGRRLHEEPQVPGYGISGKGLLLRPGMVLAIEVMYTMGGYEVEVLPDGWTVVTQDRSLSAMFEDTVAITNAGPQILTR
jgi:methionyl aminopeptidase